MLTFLHLSDLHFVTDHAGTQFDRDIEIRAALLDDLGKEGRTSFDAILVTGDVAYHGWADEFDRASKWFDEIRRKTKVPAESLFVVPGNHDVDQEHVAKGSIMWDAHQVLRSIADEDTRDKDLQRKLLDDSWDFLHPLNAYRNFAAEHGRLGLTSAQELAWVCQLNSVLDDGTPLFLHGLNSAFLSDGGDRKANLLVSPFQFRHLAAKRNCINLVMCHHPTSWLIDGNHVEDRFQQLANLVLTGHEHQSRCFPVGAGLRVCAGAVHPTRGEKEWNPGYNVIRLSIENQPSRTLVTQVETRIWHKTKFVFVGSPYSDQSKFYEYRQQLPEVAVAPPKVLRHTADAAPAASIATTMPEIGDNAHDPVFAAERRKLIIHFFRLGTLKRYEVAMAAGVWDDSDDAFEGQARWARVFERAEKANKLAALWDSVAVEDKALALATQVNPFKH